MRRALITGIVGQDGSYLAELLLAKGYEVHGVVRRTSSFATQRIEHVYEDRHVPRGPRLTLHYGDLADSGSLRRILRAVRPHEVYNLAAQSHVMVSFAQAEYTADVVALGTLRLLEALRDHADETGDSVRIFQAGSSEMFGASPPPQNERTPFYPRSPYGIAKAAAYWFAVNHREAYGMFVSNGIFFNHESPRRGETFVTRKITRAAGRIRHGLQDKLYLGNLDAHRDWGYAGDYVEAMWRILQHERADDFVVATGESHSVRDFLETAFVHAGLDWREHVAFDRCYLRPTEVDDLRGDASKCREVLGWTPATGFDALARLMVEHDLELARRERLIADGTATAAASAPGG
jgi:GDPmannose 4,6-dehydratase